LCRLAIVAHEIRRIHRFSQIRRLERGYAATHHG
jgi:hypothetical protein